MPCLLWSSFVAGLAGFSRHRSAAAQTVKQRCELLLLCALLSSPLDAALAQTPFYQDKQLVIVINFPLGGPTDAESRLLARHLGRHIAGNPAVIVKDMGRSGGALGPEWLANTAAPDGLTLGYFTGAAARAVLADTPSARLNMTRLTFIAAAPGIAVTYARTDIGGGIKRPSELIGKRDFWVGGVAPDSDRDVRTRMQLDLLGVKYQYVSGFPTSGDARMALQRGEVQVFMESLLSYRNGLESGMVATGGAMPLWFDPIEDDNGFSRSSDAEGLPALTFTDFLLKIQGDLPKSDLFEGWRLVNQLSTQFHRVLVMSPGTPKEAAAAINQAIGKLAEDPEFREDSLKSTKFVLQFSGSERTAQRYLQALSPDPKLQTWLRDYVEKASGDAVKRPGP